MPNLKLLSRVVSILLMISIVVTTSAQQVHPPAKKADEIKRKADSLTPGDPISVIPFQGRERFGRFISSDLESLSFHDIDDKVDVTLKYSEIRKLKQGYGGYNSVSQRHTDRTRGVIVMVIVVGVLGGLIGAVAASRD